MNHSALILLVDDDGDFRESVSEVLDVAGYDVAEAEDGAQALHALKCGLKPALIFIDLRMPVMDGEAFCDTWKADPELSEIPVVLVSGEAHAEEIARRCGSSGFLGKPPSEDALLAVAARLAQQPSDGSTTTGVPPQ